MSKSLEGIDPEFRRRYLAAAEQIRRELGISLSVVSAYRSRADQARLYDAWLRRQRGEPGYGWANLAAPPGRSNHERGLAIDFSPNSTPAIRAIFARYGLIFPVAGEPWHVEPTTARGGTYPPLLEPPAPPPIGEDDDLMAAADDILEAIARLAADILTLDSRTQAPYPLVQLEGDATQFMLSIDAEGRPVRILFRGPRERDAMIAAGLCEPLPPRLIGSEEQKAVFRSLGSAFLTA